MRPCAHQWAAESQDYALTLADDQDALIDAVAAGAQEVSLGASSRGLKAKTDVTLAARTPPVLYDGK